MIIKRIGVLSLAKIMGVLYMFLGFLAGLLITLFALMGAAIGTANNNPDALIALVFGVGAVIFFPIFYGILGFIGGLISAALYNLVAGMIGGIELEIEKTGATSGGL